MVITGTPRRIRPLWWQRLKCRSVSIEAQKLIARNPGFHRVIVHCRPERPVEYEHLADPAVEPSLRVLLSSIMELDPQQPDPDPYVIV